MIVSAAYEKNVYRFYYITTFCILQVKFCIFINFKPALYKQRKIHHNNAEFHHFSSI